MGVSKSPDSHKEDKVKALRLCIALAALTLSTLSAGNVTARGLPDVIDEIANGRMLDLQREIHEQMDRESAYRKWRDALLAAKVEGHQHFLESLIIWTEERDIVKSTDAFQMGVENSDKTNIQEALDLLQQTIACPGPYRANSSQYLQDFWEHMVPQLKEYRGVDDVESQTPSPNFSTPEGTWGVFLKGLEEADWKLVVMTLSAQLPAGLDLAPLEKTKEIERLRNVLERTKPDVKRLNIKAGSSERITEDIAALGIEARGSDTDERFWVIFEKRRGAWALVGTMEDIDLLKASVSR
jgi:hypothetical protein